MRDRQVSEALELANKAIAFDAAGDHRQARLAWQQASDFADAHLVGEDIYYWIKSGLGAARFEDGDFVGGIAASQLALDWCVKIDQPLPSLTIAKSHLKLGDHLSAVEPVRQAHRIIGDEVFDQLDPADREAIRALIA